LSGSVHLARELQSITAQFKRKQTPKSVCFSSGGRIWTCDLRVMSVNLGSLNYQLRAMSFRAA